MMDRCSALLLVVDDQVDARIENTRKMLLDASRLVLDDDDCVQYRQSEQRDYTPH